MSSFREVKDSFDSVYKDIMEINKQLQEMTTKVQNTKTHTRKLLDQTSSLQNDGYESIDINILPKNLMVFILFQFK